MSSLAQQMASRTHAEMADLFEDNGVDLAEMTAITTLTCATLLAACAYAVDDLTPHLTLDQMLMSVKKQALKMIKEEE